MIGHTIEGSFCGTGQGLQIVARRQRDDTDLLYRSHQRVQGVQVVLGAKGVQLPVCIIVSQIQHIAQHIQGLNVGLILQILQRGHAEAAVLVYGEDIAIHVLCGVNFAGCNLLGILHRLRAEGQPAVVKGVVGINELGDIAILFPATQGNLVGRNVSGIVHRHDNHIRGSHFGNVHFHLCCGAQFSLVRTLASQIFRLTGIGNQDSRHIPVILGGDVQLRRTGHQIAGIGGVQNSPERCYPP